MTQEPSLGKVFIYSDPELVNHGWSPDLSKLVTEAEYCEGREGNESR